MIRRSTLRHRPSDAARHRLGDAIRRNRAELEVQVAEGLLRSELYLETGRPEAAAEVIEEQRLRVAAFQGHVRDALAAAAAEAEAEAVLAGASGVDVLHDHPVTASRLPNLVAAALAAVASLAVLTVLGVGSEPTGPLASVRIGATDELPSGALDVLGRPAPDALRFRHYGSGLAGAFPATAVPESADTGAWLAEHDTMLERLGLHVRVRTQVLRELQGLVATLVPGTPLTDEMWLQVISNAVAAASDEPEGVSDDPGQAPPAEESPAEESPAEEQRDRRSWLARDADGSSSDDQAEASESEESASRPGPPAAPEPPSDGDQDGEDGGSPTPGTPGAPGETGDDGSSGDSVLAGG